MGPQTVMDSAAQLRREEYIISANQLRQAELNRYASFMAGFINQRQGLRELTAREIEDAYPELDAMCYHEGWKDGIENDRFRYDSIRSGVCIND